jgi:transposase
MEGERDRIAELEAALGERDRRIAELEAALAERDRRLAALERLVEDLRRKGKRQAAPFSKGAPKADPKRPGRKPGKGYGRQKVRAVPKTVDERIQVPCPQRCDRPGCPGTVVPLGSASQYQVDLPPIVPHTTEFVVGYGTCESCCKTVQGRHSRQVSDALRTGAVHFGPGVITWAAVLKVVGGISFEKIATLFAEMSALEVNRSTLCRALRRLGKKAEPTYQGLIENIRASSVVYPDETGWKVAGLSAWLWAFTNKTDTVYSIESGRGYAEAAKVLGESFRGTLGADGWAPYRRFAKATLQTCLAHLQRRSKEMLETATRGAVRFPRAVAHALKTALRLRDRRDEGTISRHGLAVATGRLEAQVERLLSWRLTHPGNRRFAAHLKRYQAALFIFLKRREVEATNWPAEHAIRPAVINRKTSAGNRSPSGARTLSILMSVVRTSRLKGLRVAQVLTDMLHAPRPHPHRAVLAPAEIR